MRHYRFIDWLTQGYLVLVVGLMLFGNRAAVPAWGGWLAAHLGSLALIHALIQLAVARPGHRGLDFLRSFYPVLLYAGFYRATGSLNQLFHAGYLDAVFHRLDERLFGFAPSFRFMAAWPERGWSELFHAAYFSYYLMIGGVGLALFLRRRAEFQHFVAVVSLVFYPCYLAYVLLPVVGPRIFYPVLAEVPVPADLAGVVAPEFPATVQGSFFYQVMAAIYRWFEAPGAAFPSSHVAVAIVTCYFSFRYLRRIRWMHLVLVVLLAAATVYGRYHYVVDVLAGAAVAGVLLPLGNWLYARWGGGAVPAGGAPQPESCSRT